MKKFHLLTVKTFLKWWGLENAMVFMTSKSAITRTSLWVSSRRPFTNPKGKIEVNTFFHSVSYTFFVQEIIINGSILLKCSTPHRVNKNGVSSTFFENLFRSGLTQFNDIITLKTKFKIAFFKSQERKQKNSSSLKLFIC